MTQLDQNIMMGGVAPIPKGYGTVTPYLVVKNAERAIEFYKKAFGAKELSKYKSNNIVVHAEIKIGNSIVMLMDENPKWNAMTADTLGGSPVSFSLYVENVDAMFDQAVSAGANVVMPISDQFYGDRSGMVIDPFGLKWNISTHIEDVAPEEMERRQKKFLNKSTPQRIAGNSYEKYKTYKRKYINLKKKLNY
jgi:PhnB protein